MDPPHKRYRAFISYSQRDKAIARRLHGALEAYRVPSGIEARVGADRSLGRFFRDDDEMGASQSLGAALEGALDDSDNLIVLCSPAAAQSKWVDAEVRRFKRRGGARVFAVIADGQAHAADPARECFPPALKLKIDARGQSTGEPDEPRAPDLRREGLARVRAQLAAGLLDVPFDALWQRDRRRALRNKLVATTAALLVVAVLGVAGFGWLDAQSASRQQSAQEAVSLARSAVADGRIGEALNRLGPFMDHRETRSLVEGPLRATLGWLPDPHASVTRTGVQPARLRDATVLLDPGRGAYDVSDVGLTLGRLMRTRDGQRLIAIGDQRAVVFDGKTGERLAQADNGGVTWIGHAFEAPSGLVVVTGAVMGPTNGAVWPHALVISGDGKTARSHAVKADMFNGAAAVTPTCDALLTASSQGSGPWRAEARAMTAGGLASPTGSTDFPAPGTSDPFGVAALGRLGPAFKTSDAFLGQAERNPFTAKACQPLGSDDGFEPGALRLQGVRVLTLEPVLALEGADRWTHAARATGEAPVAATIYRPACTSARPCPVIGGATDQSFVLDELPTTAADQVGPPPAPRWVRHAASATLASAPIYFEHRVFNAGHQLTVCRPKAGKDACLHVPALGEDQLELPFLRSPDGRYLFWPFGGAVFDLETLQPLTAGRAVPTTRGPHYDFEADRPGLTLAFDGRLVSFVPTAAGSSWARTDDERASPRLGVLSAATGEGERSLHTLASLGRRQYLAVRTDGVLARIDAASGSELWRIAAVGLGEIVDVQVSPERRHVLLMGKNAWRVFGLADGLAVSGLLAPPPVMDKSTEFAKCGLADALGPEGQLFASCGAGTFAWQPRPYDGDIAPRLARVTCAADVKASALDTIRRCFVDR